MAKTYDTYKDSGIAWIGEIPSEWEVKKARYLFKQRNSKGNDVAVLLSATQSNGMYPQHLLEGVVQDQKDTDLQTFKTVHKNDYVISLRSFQGGFEMSDYEGVCSPAYQVFYNTDDICHHYYKLLFKSQGFISMINSLVVGIREGKNIQYGAFSYSDLPVPPLDEQTKIALQLEKKCGEIDALISLQEEMISELQAYKQSVITEAVTKGLNPHAKMKDSGVEWIGEIPEGWKVCRLKNCITINSGEALSNEKIKEFGEYPVFGGGEMIGYFDNYNTESNELIIGRVGARCGCVTMPNCSCWATDNALKIVSDMPLRFIYYLLVSAELNTLNTSNAQPLITATKIKNKVMPMPSSIADQHSIATYLDEKTSQIDSLITLKQEKIQELKDYKKSIIYEYVTGKKRV